jgi:hypothetical protein
MHPAPSLAALLCGAVSQLFAGAALWHMWQMVPVNNYESYKKTDVLPRNGIPGGPLSSSGIHLGSVGAMQ